MPAPGSVGSSNSFLADQEFEHLLRAAHDFFEGKRMPPTNFKKATTDDSFEKARKAFFGIKEA